MNKKKIGAGVGIATALTMTVTAYAASMAKLNDDKDILDPQSVESSINSQTYKQYDKLTENKKKATYTIEVKNTKIEKEDKTVEKLEDVGEAKADVINPEVLEESQSTYFETSDVSNEVEEVKADTQVETPAVDYSQYVTMYVNVNSLNVRSTPDMNDTTNIVDVYNYQTPVSGYINGDWLLTDNNTYIYLPCLSYEQDLSYLEETQEETPNDENNHEGEDLTENTENSEKSEENVNEENTLNDENSETPVSYTGWVDVNYLNVREKDSLDSKVVSAYTKGDQLTGIIKGDWLELDNQGVKSYVYLSLLSDEYVEKTEVKNEVEVKEEETQNSESNSYEFSGYVNFPAVNVRSNPSLESNVVSALYKGDQISGIVTDGWLKYQLNGKDVYVSLSCLTDQYVEKEQPIEQQVEESSKVDNSYAYEGWVNTSVLNVRSQASTNSKIVGSLYKGDYIAGTVKDGWMQIDYNGTTAYIYADLVVDYKVEKEQAPVANQASSTTVVNNAVSASGSAVASVAQQFLGYPYVWAANSPSVGFDCSGLVYYSYQQAGITLPRTAAAQYGSGYAVSQSNLMPGDLLFFSYNGGIDHVGIVVSSDGTFIHASTPSTGVIYGNIYSPHYQSVFVGARRIF